ncbi:MAG: small basic protein [Planctomycetes bacterium]|nr:small basic protein [Planctomycetota bacterium]
MSIHRSLKGASGLTRSRNVWTRVERLEALKRDGRFTDESSIFGLPKVRTRFKVVAKRKKKGKDDKE